MLFRRTRKNKIFCIGQNKTGTTSLQYALSRLGYKFADQFKGEMLIYDWGQRNFQNIINLCKDAEAFQDIPFCLDFTYIVMDHVFKGSKFILTVRDSPEQWYNSLVAFHAKITGAQGIPTAADVDNYMHDDKNYRNLLRRCNELVYGVDENSLYDRDIYMRQYIRHNDNVLNYFRGRSSALLVLNLAQEDSYEKLCSFLGHKYDGGTMPHLNKTDEILGS